MFCFRLTFSQILLKFHVLINGYNMYMATREGPNAKAQFEVTWVHFHFVFVNKWHLLLKVALGVSPQFFSIWTRVLNHNKYVEIKQFSKEDIKPNNISTVILLIKFLFYQRDPRHLQGSRVVYIFIIPPANEVAGVYSDPYVRPFVRSFVRPSLPISNPLLL